MASELLVSRIGIQVEGRECQRHKVVCVGGAGTPHDSFLLYGVWEASNILTPSV